MKTLKDLNEMKLKKEDRFGNQYNYFLQTLENYYITRTDGTERIKAELKNWDKDAQVFILNELSNMIIESGIIGFDRNEILSLITQ